MRFSQVRDDQAVSPVIGIVLMLALVVVLAGTITVMVMGLASTQLDQATDVEVLVEGKCPGFQSTDFEPPDFAAVAQTISENNCALWLEAGNVETDGDGNVTTWYDAGPNDFHATQSDEDYRPRVIESELDDETVIDFESDNHDEGDVDVNTGDYLLLNRNVDDLELDEDDGLIVFAVLRAESFNRGGTWTIGEAGEAGREFSMRTCSDFGVGHCEDGSPGHWRAQHWDEADVDFSSEETDDQWAILVHRYDGDDVSVRVNGETLEHEPTNLDLSADRDIELGRWVSTNDNPYWYFDGKMAELLIFDQGLEDEEIENVEEYLAKKFGL